MINQQEYEQDLIEARKQEKNIEKYYKYALVDEKGKIIDKFKLQCTGWAYLKKTGNNSYKLIKLQGRALKLKL